MLNINNNNTYIEQSFVKCINFIFITVDVLFIHTLLDFFRLHLKKFSFVKHIFLSKIHVVYFNVNLKSKKK